MNHLPPSKPPPADRHPRAPTVIESLVRLEQFAVHVEPDDVVFRDELELMTSLARRLPPAEVAEFVQSSDRLGRAFARWLERAPFPDP